MKNYLPVKQLILCGLFLSPMLNAFSQTAIFQPNKKAQLVASKIVAELAQFDSLKVYVGLLHQVQQKQHSVICLQEEQIALLQKQLTSTRQVFDSQQAYILELQAEQKAQTDQIARLQKKKPRRGIWMVAGATIPILLKVFIR